MQLDGVERFEIAVEDLDGAVEVYTRLLGPQPTLEAGCARFSLDNTALALVGAQATGDAGRRARGRLERAGEGLCGMVLACRDEGCALPDSRGLPLDCVVAATRRDAPALDETHVHALDHVVIYTAQPEQVIELYRDRLGIRLALDREFPERATRLLFFRLGGVTLEFACSSAAEQAVDRFHGLAYRVQDAEAAHERLAAAGLVLGELRDGNKPGTRVFTVKSQTCGVPTLMLSDVARPRRVATSA